VSALVLVSPIDLWRVDNNAAAQDMSHMIPANEPTNTTSVQQGLQTTYVNYYPNATGYLVYQKPSNESKMPAVIMIHEWWGLNQNIKNMAEQLASKGYVVLAVDLYKGEVATEASRAQQLSALVKNDPHTAIKNLQTAVKYVSSLPNVNSSRIASLGWCFGGGWSLQLALNTTQPLAATVLYYGSPVIDEHALSKITWPVLGIFGSLDRSISVDSVKQFEAALNKTGITNEIYIYQGVRHAFANPSGDNYAPKEAADAWQKTLNFLSKYA